MDLEQIKHDVKRVIEYSQNIQNAQVDNIINDWYRAKKKWIQYFRYEPIYEYPEEVKFELDKTAKEQLIDSFVEKIENYYSNDDLGSFIRALSINEFFNNLTSSAWSHWGIEIPKNYKVIKAFKFFEDDEDKLKRIQNEASMIIQQNIVSGRLCLSVHPLDYLSLSENVHNWRSCHALDGDYRSGNMNYMMDRNTVVCYLRAEKQAILPHFPEDVIWNSKKWRVLLFMSNHDNMIFMGRQYPFESKVGLEIIKNKILPHIINTELITWSDFCSTVSINDIYNKYSQANQEVYYNNLVLCRDGLVPPSFLIKNGENCHQFNDLLSSTCYRPIYAYRTNPECTNDETLISTTRFLVGEKCHCVKCGRGYIDFAEKMICKECDSKENIDDYFECEMCGVMTHNGYEYHLPYSDMSVCPECFSKYTHPCEECGIRDIDTYVHYYPEHDNKILCGCCAQLLKVKGEN